MLETVVTLVALSERFSYSFTRYIELSLKHFADLSAISTGLVVSISLNYIP